MLRTVREILINKQPNHGFLCVVDLTLVNGHAQRNFDELIPSKSCIQCEFSLLFDKPVCSGSADWVDVIQQIFCQNAVARHDAALRDVRQ